MISRKILNATRSLEKIKYHVEPDTWKLMRRNLNVLIEAAEEVRALEKKGAITGPGLSSIDFFMDQDADNGLKVNLSRIGDLMEDIASALRESGDSSASSPLSSRSPVFNLVPPSASVSERPTRRYAGI